MSIHPSARSLYRSFSQRGGRFFCELCAWEIARCRLMQLFCLWSSFHRHRHICTHWRQVSIIVSSPTTEMTGLLNEFCLKLLKYCSRSLNMSKLAYSQVFATLFPVKVTLLAPARQGICRIRLVRAVSDVSHDHATGDQEHNSEGQGLWQSGCWPICSRHSIQETTWAIQGQGSQIWGWVCAKKGRKARQEVEIQSTTQFLGNYEQTTTCIHHTYLRLMSDNYHRVQ